MIKIKTQPLSRNTTRVTAKAVKPNRVLAAAEEDPIEGIVPKKSVIFDIVLTSGFADKVLDVLVSDYNKQFKDRDTSVSVLCDYLASNADSMEWAWIQGMKEGDEEVMQSLLEIVFTEFLSEVAVNTGFLDQSHNLIYTAVGEDSHVK